MIRLCSICARGGSKGVPGKNIRLLNGKPLIAHSIIQAQQSEQFIAIAVSSDSDEILSAAADAGADILIKRPDELATDAAAKIPVIRHCGLESEKRLGKEIDQFFDLDATSVLRNVDDIVQAVKIMNDPEVSNIFSVKPAGHSPYFTIVECTPEGAPVLSKSLDPPVVRRQDAPQCYDLNGSIYGWRRNVLMTSDSLYHDKTRLYIMPEERSIDIDTEWDFKLVSILMHERKSEFA